MLSALRCTLSAQTRYAAKLVVDKSLGKQLEKFVTGEEGKEMLSSLKKAKTFDSNYSEAVTGFSYKGKMSLATYRAQLLNACGFEVTVAKQPKPAIDLKKVAEIAAVVAGNKGLDMAAFGQEFGLQEQVEEVDKPAEVEVEKSEKLEEKPEETSETLEEAAPEENVVEEKGAVPEETAEEAPEEIAVEEKEAVLEETAEEAPEETAALEEVEAEGEDPVVPETAFEENDLAEVPEVEDIEEEEHRDSEPEATQSEQPQTPFVDDAPTEMSLEIGARLHSTYAPLKATKYTLGATLSSTAPNAPPTPAAPLPSLDVDPLLVAPKGTHIHTAAIRYNEMNQLGGELSSKNCNVFTAPTHSLHAVLSSLALARLQDQGGARFDENRDLDELFDFGVYYGRAMDTSKEQEVMKLRDDVIIPLLNADKSKKSRFPPSGGFKELLQELSLIKKTGHEVDRATFERLNEGLKPLVKSFVTVLGSQLGRVQRLSEKVDAEKSAAKVPRPVEVEVVPGSYALTTPKKEVAAENQSRMPEVRQVQLKILINDADGTWYTIDPNATNTGSSAAVVEMAVMNNRVVQVMRAKKDAKGGTVPGRTMPRRPLAMQNGEVTWDFVEMTDSGDTRMKTYKMDAEWGHITSASSKLSRINWMDGAKVAQVWYRSLTDVSSNMQKRTTAARQDKLEEREAQPEQKPAVAHEEYQTIKQAPPSTKPTQSTRMTPPAPPAS